MNKSHYYGLQYKTPADRVYMEMYLGTKKVAIQDVTNKTAAEVAHLADIQQELMGRSVHIKRITE